MILIVLFVFVFICVSSIFYPSLRMLAQSLLMTVAVIAFGLWALVEIVHK